MLLFHKYMVSTLQNILNLYQFVEMSEGKSPHPSCPWWKDCLDQVEIWIFQDKTTTKDNLREKAKNYASNYLAYQTETGYLPKDKLAEEIADEIVDKLKDEHFDTRPSASVAAQLTRNNIAEDPEEKFIKFG